MSGEISLSAVAQQAVDEMHYMDQREPQLYTVSPLFTRGTPWRPGTSDCLIAHISHRAVFSLRSPGLGSIRRWGFRTQLTFRLVHEGAANEFALLTFYPCTNHG